MWNPNPDWIYSFEYINKKRGKDGVKKCISTKKPILAMLILNL